MGAHPTLGALALVEKHRLGEIPPGLLFLPHPESRTSPPDQVRCKACGTYAGEGRFNTPLVRSPGWSGQSYHVLESTRLTRNVWSGRASQEVFVEVAVSGLASMYPASDWSALCSGPPWISARVRPQPSGEVAAFGERIPIANRGHHRAGDDRPDPRHAHQSL